MKIVYDRYVGSVRFAFWPNPRQWVVRFARDGERKFLFFGPFTIAWGG